VRFFVRPVRYFTNKNRHIKPGGYIEQLEQSVEGKSDDGSTNGTIYNEWAQHFLEAGDKFDGKTFRIVDEAKDRMKNAGFVDVVERRFKCPIGTWPKDEHLKLLGKMNRVYAEEGIEDYAMMLFTSVLGVREALLIISSWSSILINIVDSRGSRSLPCQDAKYTTRFKNTCIPRNVR
jgi:hypothetical protein